MKRMIYVAAIFIISVQAWIGPAFKPDSFQSLLLPPPANQSFIIRYHPDGGLQVGDQVSLEVISPTGVDLNKDSVQVTVENPTPKDLGKAEFSGFIGGRFRAILLWAWDTSALAPGNYTLRFSIPEKSQSWQSEVQLQPRPADANQYHWASAETQCCVVHYITGTDAEHDIAQLLPMIDAQAQDVAQRMHTALDQKMQINLVPRILGQSGFAGDEIYISYRHNNYANPNVAQLIHHEMVHRFDASIKSGLRPTFFLEGLAVYESGGHYVKEPVVLRAASLDNLGSYLPFVYLIDHFYASQHETGYMEAAALIDYMVQTWGWDSFNSFYRNIPDQPNTSQSEDIDSALRIHYHITLQQLENQYLGFLESQPLIPDVRQDVQETMQYYDAIRAYQQQLDPSAYFEQVWLPNAKQMREKGIVADYLRGPEAPINQEIEAIFYDAGNDLHTGNYSQVQDELAQIQILLEKTSVIVQY
jgi:hypothetical protein